MVARVLIAERGLYNATLAIAVADPEVVPAGKTIQCERGRYSVHFSDKIFSSQDIIDGTILTPSMTTMRLQRSYPTVTRTNHRRPPHKKIKTER